MSRDETELTHGDLYDMALANVLAALAEQAENAPAGGHVLPLAQAYSELVVHRIATSHRGKRVS